MRLCFTGLGAPIEIIPSSVSVLEVHNTTLFARICQSLQQEAGEDALEPFSWWSLEKNEAISPHAAALFVSSPLDLPWDEKRLLASIVSKMELFVTEDMLKQSELESLVLELSRCLNGIAYSLSSDYSFDVDWDMKRCLKAFGFKPELLNDETILDKCIKFLSFVADSSFNAVLVFVNLKRFLSEEELIQLYKHTFFHGLRVLLVEQVPAIRALEGEYKYIIDQDFLESWSSC